MMNPDKSWRLLVVMLLESSQAQVRLDVYRSADPKAGWRRLQRRLSPVAPRDRRPSH